MKVSLKWLQDYVDIKLSPREIAGRLTMSGTEVRGIDTVGATWDGVVLGQVVALEPHPNADRLKLATIDLGGERITVVCGAPNMGVGDNVPFARVGAQIIDGHTGEPFKLKPAKIRGIVSRGMACSEKELGISDNHQGIMILPADAPVGIPLADYLGDTILDLEVTPNRPDCLSMIGVAREVAALTGQSAHLTLPSYEESGPDIHDFISVEIMDAALCRRYSASLITGIKIAPSAPWMQRRLLACGMRPINNIVDVTNYVMLEYGQPLHAFDYERIGGKKIAVRRVKDNEAMTTLDGAERTLGGDMLVIADEALPVAIAGVMGGAESEVVEGTTSVLVESANFNPASIRRTSTRLGLRSEASIRFERGVSSEMTLHALRRATELIVELGGGKAARGVIDVYPGKPDRKPILLSTAEVKRLLGVELGAERVKAILISLGFECRAADFPSQLWVSVPYWRSDVNLAADLVEEVARIAGYDQIPPTMLSSRLPTQQPEPALTLREQARDILVACGFQEVINYSLTNMEMLRRVSRHSRLTGPSPVRIANPLTVTRECLRTSLRPGLFTTLAFNQGHEEGGLRLFEIGNVYLSRERELPLEREMLGAVLGGSGVERSWLGGENPVDFFDAKGVVEVLFDRLGVEADFRPGEDESLHPDRTAEVIIGGEGVGVLGEIHPAVAKAFELQGAAYLFEMDMVKLGKHIALRRYHPLPRYPEVIRDIALVVDAGLASREVRNLIESFPLVSQVSLFDLYVGEQIPAGKKSLAYRIVYQSPSHTLTDEEVEKIQRKIVERLRREFGAALRT